MTERRQKIRGTSLQLDQDLGAAGLLAYDTEKKELRAYDGIQLGGYRIPNLDTIDLLYKLPDRLTVKGVNLEGALHSANEALEPGWYFTSSTTTDQPEAAQGSILVTTASTAGTIILQRWIRAATNGGEYTRYRTSGGTWSAWNRVVDLAYLIANAAAKAYDASRLGGQLPAYYTAINTRLGYTAANKAGESFTGNVSVGGTFGATGAATFASTLAAGAATLASAVVTGAATVGTTLGVTGAATFGSTLSTSGKATLATLGVTGAATFSSTVTISGTLDANGSSTLAATTVTTLTASGAATFNSTLKAVGVSTLAAMTATTGAFSSTLTAPTLTVSGYGTIDRLRITSTGDVSGTSTTHGFQLGPDNSINVRFDTNEFQVYNNGVSGSESYSFNCGGTLGLNGGTTLTLNSPLVAVTQGKLTLTSTTPELKFIDSTSGQYSARMRVDANNVYFDSSTDDVTFGEVFRFELDTKRGYIASSMIWTDANTTAARIIAELAYTPADAAISITAGNGLTGGGTLGATRSLALGTPSSITNTTGNTLTSTSHTHALGFTAAEVYTGSTVDATSFPLGHIVAFQGTMVERNQSLALYLNSGNSYGYTTSAGGTVALAGTYRSRGWLENARGIFQRTA